MRSASHRAPPETSLRQAQLAQAARNAAEQRRYCPHPPSEKQTSFLRLRCREALFGGQAGGGKSDALLMAALQGVGIPGYTAILFRRTYRDLALPGALMDRLGSWLSGSNASWNGDDKAWTFPSGARIIFGYLDAKLDHLRYQSAEFQFIGPDEVTQFEEEQLLYLFSRLRRTTDFPTRFPLRFRMATNPGGIGHRFIKSRFGIPDDGSLTPIITPVLYDDGSNDVRVFVPSSAGDNPGLDLSDYRKSLSNLSTVTRKQLEFGHWIEDSTGLVYGDIHRAILVDRLPDGEPWQFVSGSDFGVNDAFAEAIIAYSEHLPECYLLSTSEPDLDLPSDCAAYLRRLNARYHFVRMVGDGGGLGKGYIEEARRRFVLPIVPVQKTDKRGYIDLFNGELASGMLRIVAPACSTFLEQSRNLIWKDERHIEEHPRQPNHSTDAALYAWRAARHYRTIARPAQPPGSPDELERALMDEAQSDSELATRLGFVDIGNPP